MEEPRTPDETPRDEPTEETARMTGGDPLRAGAPAGGSPPPPPPPPPPPQGEPRRLLRSRTDRTLFGVCGGFARYAGVDATVVRILTVVLVLFGGAGALLYLAAALLMPEEAQADPTTTTVGEPAPRNRALVIVGVVLLVLVAGPLLLPPVFIAAGVAIPLALLALVGLFVWWTVGGRRPEGGAGDIVRAAALGVGVLLVCFVLFVVSAWVAAIGGGEIVAGIVIAAGLALIAGAFVRPVRWLIVPALAVAIPAAFVGAAGIDIDGGVGEREHRPGAVADIQPRYDLGMGQLVVDLREVDLPAGDHPLTLDVGIGEAVLLVDEDVCVASRASVGMGVVDVFGRNNDGIDVTWLDTPRAAAGNARVLVDADVGVGALTVRHARGVGWQDRHENWGHDAVDEDAGANTGCVRDGRAS